MGRGRKRKSSYWIERERIERGREWSIPQYTHNQCQVSGMSLPQYMHAQGMLGYKCDFIHST